MSTATNQSKTQAIHDREKYLRFEKIAEILTYLGALSAFFLSVLDFNLPIDKESLWKLLGFVFIFAVIWFRLIPKKYSGLVKLLIYYYVTIIFIWIGVHFTQGVSSLILFFFYLTVLSSAAALEFKYFLSIVITVALSLIIEGLFFSTSVSNELKFNLTVLHLWALITIALFGKAVFNVQKISQEVGESIQLKNAKQIDSVKNEFVFIISNKLRQPILSLLNYLKTGLVLAEKQLSPEMFDLLKKTNENARRLSDLVSDLSDLSKIESQRMNLNMQEVNLNQIIGSTLSDFSMTASEKNIRLNYEPNFEIVNVKVDPSRLHEILANLVDNAIKYSPVNTQVSIRFFSKNNFAQIEIEDKGFGIPEEAKQHLFEKFYRINRSSTEAKGTGLGLFVTKELVERQGGKIWFESQVGKGTIFYFTIPLAAKV